MSLLSDKDLSLMRTTAGAALPDTCVVQSQTFISDGGGGGSVTTVSSGTFDCRLAPLLRGQEEGQVGEALTSEGHFIVTLPHDADVSTEERLVIAGDTYGVDAFRDRSWPLTQRVEVVKVS